MSGLAIEAHNLSKDFGTVQAIKSINLEIPRSRIYGFLGPNGSGKTTAIRMLCGLLTPTQGDINVLGFSIPREAEQLRLKVGYMTQKFSLYDDMSVSENLNFMADIYTLNRKFKRQRLALAVERYDLTRLLKQRAGSLSGGQKQCLALTRWYSGAASQLAQIARQPQPSPYNYHPPPIEIRTYYNPERRSPVNTVPGLIGVILTMTMVLFTAVAIVRERERGNLELLITTPVKTPELMLAKVLPYVVIGLVQVSLIMLLGHYLFQVPLRGSLLDVYIVCLVFIVANLALGLMISTLVSTQFQAMQLSFFVLLPSILLSGFMFPFAGMPHLAQMIAEALPLTHFVRLIKGVTLRGASLQELGFELAVLCDFIVVFMTLSVLRFSKRLD